MASDQQRLSAIERANLVAYLDGELTEAESLALRTKLERSASGRHEAESLRRTWELLEALPQINAPENFSSNTISIAIAERRPDDGLVSAAGALASRAGRILLLAGVAAAAAATGYALTRWAWPNPSARLAADLSIAENLDEYREVGTLEFLQELDAMPDFHQSPAILGPAEPAQP
jgi:anti-sigma factor RsiW